MSETPKTPAGEMTDAIMLAIKDHIRETEPDNRKTHHYNRAWEKVYALLETVPVARIPAPGPDAGLCGKLFVPKSASTFKKCRLPARHKGKCEPRP